VSAWPAAFVSNSPAVGYPRAESYLVWWRWQYWVEANSRYVFVHSSISTRKKHDSSDWFKMCAKKHIQTCRRKYDIYITYYILKNKSYIIGLSEWPPSLYHIYRYYIYSYIYKYILLYVYEVYIYTYHEISLVCSNHKPNPVYMFKLNQWSCVSPHTRLNIIETQAC